MKNGKEYIIKFSKQAEKDKTKLKSSGLDKNCKNILTLMLTIVIGLNPTFTSATN